MCTMAHTHPKKKVEKEEERRKGKGEKGGRRGPGAAAELAASTAQAGLGGTQLKYHPAGSRGRRVRSSGLLSEFTARLGYARTLPMSNKTPQETFL